MLQSIQAVYFDAVGTLLHPQPSAAVVYAHLGHRFGSRYHDVAGRFAKAFAEQEDQDRKAAWQTNEEREYRRWRTIVADVLDDVGDAEACFKQLYEHFARSESWRAEGDAERVLRELESRGFRLGIASNYDRRLRSVLAGLPELRALSYMVISSEVGWRKPAKEFFQAMQKKIDVPASNILYVGDDPQNDYEGGLAAGMQAVLFDPRGKHDKFIGRRIRSLRELVE